MANLVGIDVGSYITKVVLIERRRTKKALVKFFSFKTPYTSNFSLDHKEFINQLTSFLPPRKWERVYVGINTCFSPITVLTLDLPKMRKRELNIAVINEARRKVIPPPELDTIFEYAILEEEIVERKARYKILVIRTERNFIDEIMRIFDIFPEASPVFISPLCFTFSNLFLAHLPFINKDIASIDIGFTSMDISIFQKGKLSFYRNIKFGLKDIISHFSESLGLKFEETEALIKKEGIPQIDIDLSDRVKIAEEIMRQKYEISQKVSEERVNILELRMLWQTEIERIVQEIRRTFVYYKQQEKRNVEGLIFLGGASQIKGLVSFLDTQIGGEILPLDLLIKENIEVDSEFEKEIPTFASSVSIALSIPLAKKEEATINFLPVSLKKREYRLIRQIEAIVIGAILLVFSFLGWMKLSVENIALKNKLEKIEKKLKGTPLLLTTLENFKEKESLIKRRSKVIEYLLKERRDFAHFLEILPGLVPKEIFLLSLKIEKVESQTLNSQEISQLDNNLQQNPQDTSQDFPSSESIYEKQKSKYILKIEGATFSDYETLIKITREFKKRMEESGYFEHIHLKLPFLEKISPVIEKEKIVLTEIKFRKFSLEAEIIE